jgi:hypothetical protein
LLDIIFPEFNGLTDFVPASVVPKFSQNKSRGKRGEMIDRIPNSVPSHPARRFTRYPLDMKVHVHVFRDGKTVSFWGRSTEFAEDGLSATLTGEVEAGEVISMELSLPHVAFPLKLRALVRYRHGLRHGVEFLARNADQHKAIRDLCESLAKAE